MTELSSHPGPSIRGEMESEMRAERWNVELPATSVLVARVEEPGHGAEGVDTRLLVEALLDGLSPPIRAALVLRELEGLGYEEIARVLGIPIGTVRSRLSAARK